MLGEKRFDYERDGFLRLDELISTAAVARLRDGFDELISGGADDDRHWGGLIRQVMMPSLLHPSFAENEAVEVATGIATELLGTESVRTFDMLIDKPPGHPHETPWHQDMAYSEMPLAPAGVEVIHESVQFWFALDDVDTENGCMHYVPGVHRKPLLGHEVTSNLRGDDSRLLGIVDPHRQLDLATAVPCPLRAGGAVLHSYGTPHYTPPNRSARPRRAYVVNYLMMSTLEEALETMLTHLEAAGRLDIAAQVREIAARRDMLEAVEKLTPVFRDLMTELREGEEGS